MIDRKRTIKRWKVSETGTEIEKDLRDDRQAQEARMNRGKKN